MNAEIAEEDPFGQVILDQLTGRRGKQHLTAVRGSSHPGGPVHRQANVPLTRRRSLTRVNTDPDAHPRALRPGMRRE